MATERKETARQAYIRLLAQRAGEIDSEPHETKEGILCGELIEEKYLEGAVLRDQQGCIRGAAVVGLTVKGRLFLQELERLEHANTFWGRYRSYILLTIGYLFGLLSPVLTKLLERAFHL